MKRLFIFSLLVGIAVWWFGRKPEDISNDELSTILGTEVPDSARIWTDTNNELQKTAVLVLSTSESQRMIDGLPAGLKIHALDRDERSKHLGIAIAPRLFEISSRDELHELRAAGTVKLFSIEYGHENFKSITLYADDQLLERDSDVRIEVVAIQQQLRIRKTDDLGAKTEALPDGDRNQEVDEATRVPNLAKRFGLFVGCSNRYVKAFNLFGDPRFKGEAHKLSKPLRGEISRLVQESMEFAAAADALAAPENSSPLQEQQGAAGDGKETAPSLFDESGRIDLRRLDRLLGDREPGWGTAQPVGEK